MNWQQIIPSIIVMALAVALIGGVWLLWWGLPKWQVDRFRIPDPKTRADVEDNFRKTIGQLLGGLAVLLGAGFAYLQFTQQQRAAHDLLISNQVSKGFELLGNDKVEVRLGGIYALEGVMNTSEQYHQPITEALSAFVRYKTQEGQKIDEGEPAADIETAVNVIGRRELFPPDAGPDLGYARIPHAYLREANLAYANLSFADLHTVYLGGALLDKASLIGANLRDAVLGETGVGAENMPLRGASLVGADLTAADLSGAYLRGANLRDARWGGEAVDVHGRVHRFDLTKANLTNAVVTQAQLDLACGTDVQLDPGLTIKPCPRAPQSP